MRCFPALTVAIALVSICAGPARSQQCDNGLPQESDFPEAASTCKNKLKLAPWLGMPAEVFTLTGRCMLSVTVCRGETKCYRSEIREQKDDWCKDYSAKYDWLSNRTICCDPKCERPAPWLDGLMPHATKCKNRQASKVTVDGRFAFLTMCGSSVFVYDLKGQDISAYRPVLSVELSRMIGTTVCCDSFNAAARSGSSCDPRTDVDCDGISNGVDVTADGRFPDLTTFVVGAGISSKDTDPLPSCFWPPDPSECDCKWELTQGIRSLTPDRRHYRYDGRWRCPSTGKEVVTDRQAFETYACGPGHERQNSVFFTPRDQPFGDAWAEPQNVTRSNWCTSAPASLN